MSLKKTDKEVLSQQIIDIIGKTTQGIQIKAIAEELGVDTWRALIPLLQELCDQGHIGKKGKLYFRC